MINVESVIQSYLSKQTEYCIQLNGVWGCGKTFYVKTKLLPLVNSLQVYNDAKKHYKTSYISLFGKKTVEEVASSLALDFFHNKLFARYIKKRTSSKVIRITGNIVTIAGRGFLNLNGLGRLNDFRQDLEKFGANTLDSTELVVFFDDLERMHPDLSYSSLAGYVNTLVDQNVKVIIISNQDKLDHIKDYSDLKEIITGITIEFNPNIHETIETIITTRYSGSPSYKEYLITNIRILENLTKAINNNFRHFIYCLDNIHSVYSEIKTSILDTHLPISTIVESKLPTLLKQIFAYSAEYKSSKLSYNNSNEFQSSYYTIRSIFEARKDDSKKANILSSFLEKYKISPQDYTYIDSLFRFCTSHDNFNTESFIKEFSIVNHLIDESTSIQHKVLLKLDYLQCYDLSDDLYFEYTKEMVKHAKEGLYSPAEYITVLHYAERFNNPLGFNLFSLVDELSIGLRVSIANTLKNNQGEKFHFELSHDEDMSDSLKRLYKNGLELFEELSTIYENEKLHSHLKLLLEKPLEFQNLIVNDEQIRKELYFKPILNLTDPEFFVESIKLKTNKEILFIKNFLEDRFKDTNRLIVELENIKKIKELLIQYCSQLKTGRNNKIRTYIIELLLIPFSDL